MKARRSAKGNRGEDGYGDLELELEALQINLSQARKQMEIGNAHRFGFQVAQETLEEEKRLFDLAKDRKSR